MFGVPWDAMTVQHDLRTSILSDGSLRLERRGNYDLRVTYDAEDRAWDAFLGGLAGGHYMQSSLWAQVKSTIGWDVCRIIAQRGHNIVGGAQLLIRQLPLFGAVGYIPRGPVFATDDTQLMDLMVQMLQHVARRHRVQYMLVQPSSSGARFCPLLTAAGFRRSSLEAAPMATVLIDLSAGPSAVLAGMKPKTRYNVRVGLRKGFTVRQGTADDLPTFHHLLVATGRRRHFRIHSEAYFTRMWNVLNPQGHIKLFIAEYAGRAVSAMLGLAFGDTVTYWRGAWSGEYGQLHPNEALHWAAIEWAQLQGYRWYDLDGIESHLARALIHGELTAATLPRTDTSYKLGFGGSVTLFPDGYDYLYNPMLRRIHSIIFSTTAQRLKATIVAAARGIGWSKR